MPYSWSGCGGAHRRHRQAVAEQQVVGGADRRRLVVAARRVVPGGVAEERRAPRLVERGPGGDAVAEAVVDRGGVLGEARRGVARRPAAGVLQRLGQVPVVQRDPRLDAGGRAARRRAGSRSRGRRSWSGPASVGLDARPGDREAVGADAELAPSARRRRGSGGSGRRRRRRCRRRAPCRACARSVSQIDSPRPSSATAPSIW